LDRAHPLAVHLTTLFDLSFLGRAARPAIEYTDAGGHLRTMTFGALEARANQMAAILSARGLARGDRLCAHLPNRIELIDLFLGCTRLGVILVPMNVLYRDRELKHIVGDSDPKAIVTVRGSDAVYPTDVPTWPVEELAERAASQSTERRAVHLEGSAPALIVYTSGTTGAAKGAVLSHDNLATNGINLATCWQITEADRYLAVLPLFHVHGLANGLHTWLISGCLMRLAERFDHRAAAALFTDFKPTVFFGVPTVYVRLLDPAVVPDDLAQTIGDAARLFVCGSAPLPAHTMEAFTARYGHTILERYGMSEALMIISNPYAGERRAGTVGFPLPGTQVRIVDERDAPVGDEEVGEVHVKSPHLFSGYWQNAAATAAAHTTDGWFRTGDLGLRSADGYYALRGRKGDMIISAGFNIYPREIEEVLLEDGRVTEATVVGAHDVLRGEVPVAYIVADPKVDIGELEALCRRQLASFKIPRAFVRVGSLPRTALGKVQKHLLPPWTAVATSDDAPRGLR
jgi:malonyl-CoA/methylmalonyl-CoA synthetase